MLDPRLADAMQAAGIIDTDQADRLRAELERINAEDFPDGVAGTETA